MILWNEKQPSGNNNRDWTCIASDADGSNLIAGCDNWGADAVGRLYTSSNNGVSWTERQPAGDFDLGWWAVASDNDGSNLFAAIYSGGFGDQLIQVLRGKKKGQLEMLIKTGIV